MGSVPGDRVRVAHVITRMIVGGAQETVLLAAALADRERFEPVVVTGPQLGPEGSLLPQLAARGVPVVVVPSLVRQVSPRRDAVVVRALAEVFRARAIDVVHTNSSKAGIAGRWAARRARVPRVVHTVHGWPFHEHQPRPVAGAWRLLERRAAPLADALVVVAETDRTKGLEAGIGRPGQYVTLRSGLELDLYGPQPTVREQVRAELGLPAESVVVGAVNRLSPQKDPVTLVRALGPLLRARPGLRLLLVGDGPLRTEVEAAVAELGVAAQVVLPGLRDDVPRLLAAMDVFVTASLWEGLPRTVVQAMATRLPVVATAADGIVDVVRDGVTGLLAAPGDAASLRHAVGALLDRPDRGAALAEAAADQLPDFDAARMVRGLEAIYDGSRP